MSARRLPNGNLLIPRRAESPDGKVIGDALVEVGPDREPESYWRWVSWLARKGPREERAYYQGLLRGRPQTGIEEGNRP